MSLRPCGDCGCYGHKAGTPACPYSTAQKRQDPYRVNPPRPPVQPVSDPALRDAPASMTFMIPPRRLV